MNSKQLKYDIAYLRMAREWAKLSHCKRKQVGALIVKNRMIISDGFNGTPSGFDNCCEDEEGVTKWEVLHAEANAILKVARSTQSWKVQLCTSHFLLVSNAANSSIRQESNEWCIPVSIKMPLVWNF